ncbi:EF-P beta-lysylation protein EpmB [Kushneria phyllosphaerae]|uniref:L-lysine 2,3-aminomutase n=1 Tax=Kushneria phyllosphaerae TaxID=2100822 RepID=A0A2R8CNL4_9GAMM|nr:EF-P beta-lysylation protein EpmB [Kushneria phyllosphaerae]SPJ34491.1 L-lysine 2,3-aminomutase [Kushneria phyllosphaerae]
MQPVQTISLSAAGNDSPPDQSWQSQLSGALRDPKALLAAVGLDERWLPGAEGGHQAFEVRVPQAYLSRIQKGNPNDPLLRQVLPLESEMHTVAGYVTDPLEEADHTPAAGLIHKYAARVLMITSGACAINCRYCFRRHFPYEDHAASRAQWGKTLDYLRHDDSLIEAILSGGDPLVSSDARLAWLVGELDAIPHLKRLRLHTRLPVVIPDRVDDAMLEWLGATRLQKVIVLHINHANEIDDSVMKACERLKGVGVTLLNQSVLLRGVNDNTEVLAGLSERLFEAGILPYYLHVLDPVAGAAHFDVPDHEARQLHEALRDRLPGFLVPRLVREIPGEQAKSPIEAWPAAQPSR